jgi:hypothetical protein
MESQGFKNGGMDAERGYHAGHAAPPTYSVATQAGVVKAEGKFVLALRSTAVKADV